MYPVAAFCDSKTRGEGRTGGAPAAGIGRARRRGAYRFKVLGLLNDGFQLLLHRQPFLFRLWFRFGAEDLRVG